MKEFLKLDNKLNLELKIKPLSPLCIKLSKEEKEGEESKSSTYSTILVTEQGETKVNNTGELELDTRKGEIYIPGSTLKGLFRDRFTTMYKDNSFVKNLFGYTEGNSEDEKARKSRIFLQDAFFFENEKRKNFYDINKIKDASKNEAIKEFVSSRSITPIDHFSSKAVAPLKFEYTTEDFRTEIFLNNMSDFKELQGIYFIIRDSINGEIRIGNSKTRGFGQIEFEVSDLRYSVFHGKEENFKKFEQFFKIDEERSTKIADKYLEKVMRLKDEYKKVDIKAPNEFIKTLFSEVK
ncbi:RAMP superfamily CRISPR-associated protein [Fusobacterium polymorphum]|jgi:hypothetical protein|uniref:RAMP superfamily CRISPR-associated protein n=1 Tax=Fusobacterium nucleatum subsp. polymorphum TaxID=76857 RepID=UPI00291ECEA3|nr:hypothetical protein FNCP11_03980 [Fusobacterium nucleatum]BEP09474.1 hypothetical protein FNSP11_03180 [Fusobacterium nucleatum]